MSVIATALKHLMAAGVTGDDLVRAVADMEASQPKDHAAEKRREWDRDRKRAQKALEDAYVSGGIPPDPVESGGNAELAPALDKSPQTPKINPTPHVGVGIAPTRKATYPVPEGCDPDDWRDLLANRRSKRMTMTPSIYRKILKDLAAYSDDEWPPGRVLRHAAERGWAAIFDPRQSNGIRNGKRPANDRPDEITDSLARAAFDSLGIRIGGQR